MEFIGNPINFSYDGVHRRMGILMEESRPYSVKSMGTNFPASSNRMSFAGFSHAMGSLWANPCISHVMKHTVGWESDGEKNPYYGKSMNTSFACFQHTMGFIAFLM